MQPHKFRPTATYLRLEALGAPSTSDRPRSLAILVCMYDAPPLLSLSVSLLFFSPPLPPLSLFSLARTLLHAVADESVVPSPSLIWGKGGRLSSSKAHRKDGNMCVESIAHTKRRRKCPKNKNIRGGTRVNSGRGAGVNEPRARFSGFGWLLGCNVCDTKTSSPQLLMVRPLLGG